MFGRGEGGGGGNGHVRIVFQVKTLVHQISNRIFFPMSSINKWQRAVKGLMFYIVPPVCKS